MNQKSLFGIEFEVDPTDIVKTPDDVVRDVISFFQPTGKCLDPCKGDGAFWQYLPQGSEWCEIREGRDFFEYTESVDWIIGNPPYSIFAKWLYYSFEIADNIVYVIPVNKVFNSNFMLKQIYNYGGIKHIRVMGHGSLYNRGLGFAIGAVHFQRSYRGEIGLSFRPCNNALAGDAKGRRKNGLPNFRGSSACLLRS
jgi:hypothetical protein